MLQNNVKNVFTFSSASIGVHIVILFTVFFNQQKLNQISGNQDQSEIKVSLNLREVVTPKEPVIREEKLKPTKKQIVQKVSEKVSAIKKESIQPKVASIKGKQTQKIMNRYTAELKAFLDKNKVYPRMAARLGQSGIVEVKVSIDAEGKFSSIEILNPAAFDSLNSSTVDFLTKLGSFKPLPKEFYPKEDFIIPIVYKLSRQFR